MRFVADESCDHRVVVALRAEGHAVDSIAETDPGSDDEDVLKRATGTKAILLTEDLDFGRLVYFARRKFSGVVLLRFPELARPSMPSVVTAACREHAGKLDGHFSVIEPGRFRTGSDPTSK